MATSMPYRPSGHSGPINSSTSFTSFPTSSSHSSMSEWRPRTSSRNPSTRGSGRSSKPSSTPSSVFGNHFARPPVARTRKLRSQYPLDSDEPHVEYILVASFHVDKGPIMEHQYPAPISGDEHMLAELMLPDQAHVRKQDWTIFFLHKDNGGEDEKDDYSGGKQTAGGEEDHPSIEQDPDVTEEERKEEERQKLEDAMGGSEGPPLIYVLNLVNTKQDPTVKRGAVVKAMAICTRHSFLHIYKPLLLLALDEYFKSPRLETLASLYDAVNSMDLSLMPRLSLLERIILQASDSKDMFIEKFEQMIQQRMAGESKSPLPPSSPDSPSKSTTDLTRMVGGHRYTLPRDTHEYETRVIYNGIPIPVKVPTAVSPETVGDFSLIKLIQTFAGPHSTSPQPFMLHSHLTTAGAYTHPIIVLMNAMLTQKRVIFIGHNRPSGEVAEAVLAACALASGGILKGFTRHAFPYTDLTKIDALLKVPGFIAGVTNPAFANHPEWWDLLCDIPTGRMKISSRIAPAPVTEGLVYFNQQISLSANNVGSPSTNNPSDPVGDQAFMDDVLRSIANRYGEANIRARWRDWVVRFTRMAAVFEEIVYGASALYIGGDVADAGAAGVSGHGYVWSDDAARQRELSGAVSRIEGWRNTRSYYSFIQDLAQFYTCCPISQIDLHHHHDRLRSRKLTHNESAAIYFAFNSTVHSYAEICQLLTLAPESHAGLFYLSLGLFHPEGEVRVKTAELLERIMEHDAGRHFWASLSRFAKLAFLRIRKSREAAERKRVESNPGFAMRS